MENDLDLNKKYSIEFSHVSKEYANTGQRALSDVSFQIPIGSYFFIIGESGCGKSTILKIIAGLESQSTGRVLKPENVGMVFQSGALLPWLSVYENVAFGLRAIDAPEEKIKTMCEKYITMMGLTEYKNKYPRELSGGERQRVGIARALAIEPEILLLDEPFSALDAKTVYELHKDILKIWQETKKTIIMVSHSIEEAVGLAEEIILMKNGKIEKIFPITLPHPRHEEGAAFMHDVETIRKEFFK